MFYWITESGIIYTCNEKTTLPNDLYVSFYSDEENVYSLISSNYPETVEVSYPIKISENIYSIKISGTIPSVPENKTFSICARLKDKDHLEDGTFIISVKNVPIEWSSSIPDVIEFPTNTYNLYKLVIDNSNGDEVIKKISGAFPEGISISNDGSIFGEITDDSLIGKTFSVMVTVFIDNIAINRMNKTINIKVVYADPYDKPTWITEEGYIGSLYVDKASSLRVVATNSTSTQAVFYKLLIGSNLPDGITFEADGRLSGVLATKRTQDWYFNAVAFKLVNDEEIQSEPRTFYITTNPTSEDDKIIWDDQETIIDLGTCIIGQMFYGRVMAHTKSGLKVKYKIIGDTAPKGLILSEDGVFSGNIDFQETKEYLFTIKAYTTVSSAVKTAKLLVKKGLGKYAATLSFPIWLKNIDTYNSELAKLDKNLRYKPLNKNFKLNTQPKIDICVIRSYDKELLPLVLNFAYPEWVRFGETHLRNVLSIDRYDGTVLDNYDVVYKSFDEATYQWNELYNGSYDWKSHKTEGASLEWNVLDYDGNKIELPPDNAHPNPINKFKIMNIPNIRECLTQKIYLKQQIGTVWYYDVDQRIVPNDIIVDIPDDVNEYYVNRDNQKVKIYKIEDPFIYSSELNPEFEIVTDFVLPHIADIVEQEYGKYYCQLLDIDNEVLPYWKRKEPVLWTTNTFFKANTVLLYDQNYYIVNQDFTSTYNFNDNLEYVRKLSYSEVDMYLSKNYFPALEYGYYIAGKNAANVRAINKEEKDGAYWTGQIFVFDEVLVDPYFDVDMDMITVTITYPNLKNYPDTGILEKE